MGHSKAMHIRRDTFLVDTCIFIESAKIHHPMDIFPSLWGKLLETAGDKWFTCKPVANEIKDWGDDVFSWFDGLKKTHPEAILDHSPEDIQKGFADITQGIVDNAHYKPFAKEKFLSGADPWLLAFGRARGYKIVTRETIIDPNIKKRIKIPNVCKDYNIDCLNLNEFLRYVSFKF
ncbi:DUF4411 family protein [Oecophyllibacter saccharovorans]|uniref:DUF4411 family protein n=1 Tax=Oecophyllibacter saccharovorans TaxID=2558360 RepID=UPI00116DA00F|nr:DUF4411 family protein [Oecophyllibacter saccharovorans]TPW35219.1 DUF4411 family protein [Oecophyllibacter saccharovorans]